MVTATNPAPGTDELVDPVRTNQVNWSAPIRLPPHIDLPHPQLCRFVGGCWHGRGWPAVSHSLCDERRTLCAWVPRAARCGRGVGRPYLLWQVGCSRRMFAAAEAQAEKAFRRVWVGCVAGRDAYVPRVYAE